MSCCNEQKKAGYLKRYNPEGAGTCDREVPVKSKYESLLIVSGVFGGGFSIAVETLTTLADGYRHGHWWVGLLAALTICAAVMVGHLLHRIGRMERTLAIHGLPMD